VENLGLESQLESHQGLASSFCVRTRSHPPSLRPRFDECTTEGRAALSRLALARDASDSQRAKEILPLVADINTLRLNTYSDLAKIGGKRWARSFFA
jgi:hypothetical protein